MANKSWFQKRLKDPFLLKARRENFRSRAAYKLREICQKYKIFRPGQTVLDLGAAPGSWTQIILENLHGKGAIIAVDLLPIEPLLNVEFIQGDIRDENVQIAMRRTAPHGFDTIVSDMAPDTTGIHHADTSNSAELVSFVLDFCCQWLNPKGSLLAKVFEGVEYKEIQNKAKTMFSFVKSFSPKASLSRSREVYLVALDFNKT